MRRRGFLSFLAGGAVAGPGMMKQAAAASLADLSLPNAGVWIGSSGISDGPASAPWDGGDWRVGQLAKLAARSAAEHALRIRRTHINTLDPDLASYRSIALHRKISLQRERQYWRELEEEKGWLGAYISGLHKE